MYQNHSFFLHSYSSGDLAAKLGHLQVMTSVENGVSGLLMYFMNSNLPSFFFFFFLSVSLQESCVVKLKGKLSGTVVAFNLQGWQKGGREGREGGREGGRGRGREREEQRAEGE